MANVEIESGPPASCGPRYEIVVDQPFQGASQTSSDVTTDGGATTDTGANAFSSPDQYPWSPLVKGPSGANACAVWLSIPVAVCSPQANVGIVGPSVGF